MDSQIKLLTQENWQDYELLDFGNESKFERFGKYLLIRPESQALTKPLFPNDWEKADAILEGRKEFWKFKNKIPDKWAVGFDNLKFWAKATPFGHLGVFPEQSSYWTWIKEKIKESKRELNVLNLFGYTGIATLVASNAGAKVCHVDASKPAITWAVENQKLSGLEDKSIRWILDDAITFVKREIKRGNKYDAIIMDPPKFGRGPKGEVWQFEDSFTELMDACRSVLSENPVFIAVTAYTVPVSSITIGNFLQETMKDYGGKTEYGELGLKDKAGRILPTAIFARWSI